jgi:hypothetical protein
MIIKIHRATPAPLKLIDLAKAGVAIKMINAADIIAINDFLLFNMIHSPFLFGFNY